MEKTQEPSHMLVNFDERSYELFRSSDMCSQQEALERVAARGRELPLTWDVYRDIIFPGHEGKLHGWRSTVHEDVVHEWTGEVWTVIDDWLYKAHVAPNQTATQVMENQVGQIKVAGLPLEKDGRGRPISLRDIMDDNKRQYLSLFAFGVPFQNFPSEAKEKAHIWLPPEGEVRPISYSKFNIYTMIREAPFRGMQRNHSDAIDYNSALLTKRLNL